MHESTPEVSTLRAGFGDHFVDYYMHIKDAEIARYREEVTGESDQADVTEWGTAIFRCILIRKALCRLRKVERRNRRSTALNRPDLVAVHESGNGPSRHLP